MMPVHESITGRCRVERNREVRMEVRSQALVDVVEDVICDVPLWNSYPWLWPSIRQA